MTITGITAGHPAERAAGGRTGMLRAAQRHTRAVRVLRIALPLAAALVTAVLFAVIVFDPRAQLAAQIDAEALGVSGSRIVMERPHLTGHSEAGKAYDVTAIRAEQDMQTPEKIGLFDLHGRMEIREDGWAELEAGTGQMNTKVQNLALRENIRIRTDIGERAQLQAAFINFRIGEIVSKHPVDITFTRGTLKADSMHLINSAKSATFTGRVRMTLQPDTAAPVEPAPEAPR